jgi:hypothetical protein
MINVVLQVRHSNMNGNARQPLFPVASFSSSDDINVHIAIEWIFLLTKKWG